MNHRSGAIALFCLGAALSWPSLAAGQSIGGTVLDMEQGLPLPGTFLVLLNEAGEERSRSLTTRAGTYLLRAPGPGSYRIRVQRIGVVDVTTDVIRLDGRRVVSHQIRVPLAPVHLANLSVTVAAESRCGTLQEDALALYRVWEEARKALEATFWTGQQTYYRFDALLSRRNLDTRGNQTGETELESIRVYGRHPFRSARADDLAFGGWVRPTGSGGVKFHAPDAEVLLSESFRSRHCYSLLRESVGDHVRLGLQFVPMDGRRLPDISGILWLNEETAELESLDFKYEVLELPFDTEWLGGHVEFGRLPDGGWIVQRWLIRTPITRSTRSQSFSGRRRSVGMRLTGLYEEGQQVTAVWHTGDLRAGPDDKLPEDVPPVHAPSDRLLVRY